MLNDLSAMAKKLDSKASSLPKVTERIIKELEEHRLVYLTGKAGCLTYENLVDVKVVRKVKPLFISSSDEEVENFLSSISGNYYVYLFYGSDLKKPLYIGKGRFLRALDHTYSDTCYSEEFFNFLDGNEYHIAIDSVYNPEDENKAYAREAELIDYYEVKNLFNRCNGSNNKISKFSSKHNSSTIIQKFISIHGERYDYSKYIYLGMDVKSTIICRVHGTFEQSPGNHICGNNCPKCVGGIAKEKEHYITLVKSYLETFPSYIQLGTVTENTRSHDEIPFLCKICGKVHKKTFGRMRELKGCNYCGTSSMRTPFNLKLSNILSTVPDIHLYLDIHTGINARRRYSRVGVFTATCKCCGEHFTKDPNRFLDGRKHNRNCTKKINRDTSND